MTTDDSGAYNAPNLTPGTYKVRAEFKGFKAVERDNVLLETGSEVRVDYAAAWRADPDDYRNRSPAAGGNHQRQVRRNAAKRHRR